MARSRAALTDEPAKFHLSIQVHDLLESLIAKVRALNEAARTLERTRLLLTAVAQRASASRNLRSAYG